MKKDVKKFDLVKVSGIMVLFTVLLTWIVPQGSFSGTAISVTEITRIGLFDFFTYGLLGMYYFTVLVTFVFVLGGFYQVLSRIGGYQALISKIAKLFKKKEKDITTSTAAQEINILDIKNNLIYTRDNLIIAILKINSLNMQLFSKKELINKIKDIF